MKTFTLLLFCLFWAGTNTAQTFQKDYGTPLDNSFSKVIPDGAFYYVLGQDETVDGNFPAATVTRLNNSGVHQWTLRTLIPANWRDALRLSNGDLLLVGNTLPLDPSAKSLFARVSSGGSLVFMHQYDVPGRDLFSRIILNPNPDNAAFPYYILGGQLESAGTFDDVVLLAANASGGLLWKKLYISSADDEFVRDLEVIPGSGDLILAGNTDAGLIYKTDHSGNTLTGVRLLNRVVRDVELNAANTAIYAASTDFFSSQSYLQKFDTDLLLLWEVQIPQLTSIGQVWEGLPGELYITGVGNFGGLVRPVIVRLLDNGGPTVVSVDFFTAGAVANNGSAWYLPPLQIAYTDTRTIAGGFGQSCAFMAVSDLDITNCQVSNASATLVTTDPIPEGAISLVVETLGPPMPVVLTEAQLADWQEQIVCELPPCTVAIGSIPINNCGLVQLTAIVSGPGPYSIQWCDGSTAAQYVTQLPCGESEVCVQVMCADGALATATQTFNITDLTPPTAICASAITLQLDTSCQVNLTPPDINQGSFDDCFLVSTTVMPNQFTGCGEYEAVLVVEDWCGNMSSCTTAVTVEDKVAPTITCPSGFTFVAAGTVPCTAIIDNIQWLNASDNCGILSIVHAASGATVFSGNGDASGSVFNSGQNTITYTVLDVCGNTASCSFSFFVECDPNTFDGFECGQAVVTCFSGFLNNTPANGIDPNAAVFALVDLRDQSGAIPGNYWQSASTSKIYHAPGWNAANMGQVFGIATAPNNEIYLTSTTVYGCQPDFNPFGPAGASGIYRIDPITGAVSQFVTTGPFSPGSPQIPNSGGGLGNIAYDLNHNQFFVTNQSDGRIYRIDASGNVLDRFDPQFLAHPSPCNPGVLPGFAPLGQRLWGIGYNQVDGKLYFARWVEDKGRICPTANNQIFSIGIDPVTGNFLATNCSGGNCNGGEVLEITMPDHLDTHQPATYNNYSMPVSDIEFSQAGWMLVGERSMGEDCGEPDDSNTGYYPKFFAHQSRVLEYYKPGASWQLTPGHAIPPFTNYANDLKFSIGFPGQSTTSINTGGPNCVGGVDYGYQSFDPANGGGPIFCDSMVWSSGDALVCNPTGLICGSPLCANQNVAQSPDRIYGIQGNPASGGDHCSGLLIDLDGDICCYDKRRNGDIDILKCISCESISEIPCDSLDVSIYPEAGNLCCYYVDLTNNFGTSISKIEIDLLTAGVIFNTTQINLAAGFQFAASNSDQTLCITHSSGSIPPGTTVGALRFCYSGVDSPGEFPQQLQFTWWQTVNGAQAPTNCVEFAGTDCPATMEEDPCIAVNNVDVDCNPANVYEYFFTFNVTNLSTLPAFNAYTVNLYGLPAGFFFSPCVGPSAALTNISLPIPGAPLAPGNTSPNMCVKIITTTPIVNPLTICMQAKLIGLEACCTTASQFCITLEPCCDPCEEIAVEVSPAQQGTADCCYSLDLINDCPIGFFTKMEIEVTTPGVNFGYYALNPSQTTFWSLANSSNTKICATPNSGAIPSGTINQLLSFCLDQITSTAQVPQTVVIRWITTSSSGLDSIACDTSLIFDCPPEVDYDCLSISDIDIDCLADSSKYLLTFTVTNLSQIPFPATSLDLILLSPSDLVFSPSSSINFNPLLPPNGSQTVSICLFDTDGLPGGGNIVFIPKLSWLQQDTCCYENEAIEIPLPPCDSCCTSFDAFCQAVDDATSLIVDDDLCKVTLQIDDLPCDDYLEWVDWGDQVVDQGPFFPGSMPMHTYTGPGTYTISYLAIELDDNGLICFEKIFTETITIACDTCFCGAFSNMYFRWKKGVPGIQVNCDSAAVQLPCPDPGQPYRFSGLFQCVGANCPPTTQVNWTLTRLPATPITSGTTLSQPQFGFFIHPIWYQTPGMYEIQLSGQCGSDTCTCRIRFNVDCPGACPCGPDELQAFSQAVSQGFAVTQYPNSCKTCFSPKVLSGCETVSWHINDVSNPPIATSVNNQTVCHTFPGAGTYTVIMVVTRLKPDGTICEVFTHEQTVTVTCGIPTDCTTSAFDNPTFKDGAISGILGAGGESEGWMAAGGEPGILEGEIGSLDGWTAVIRGNFDSSDVLTQMEEVCIEKATGSITMNLMAWRHREAGHRLTIMLDDAEGFDPNSCPEEDCRILAELDMTAFSDLDTGEWVTMTLPYDLSDWAPLLTCGDGEGVRVKPYLFVDNCLGNNQSIGSDSRSSLQFDNFCFEGQPLGVLDRENPYQIRLFPNPSPGHFTLQTGELPGANLQLEITDLLGQQTNLHQLEPSQTEFYFTIEDLPAGVYFVKLTESGRQVWVSKVLKH